MNPNPPCAFTSSMMRCASVSVFQTTIGFWIPKREVMVVAGRNFLADDEEQIRLRG